MTADPAPQNDPLRPAASQARRFVFAVLLLALLTGLCSPFFIDPIANGAPKARGGEISYAKWGPLKAPVRLAGDWRLVWRTAPAPGAVITAPCSWVRGSTPPA